MKLLDTNILATRGLVCYIYDILKDSNPNNKEKIDTLDKLQNLKLPVFQLTDIPNPINSIQEIIDICEDPKTKEHLNQQDLEFDGLVIKVKENNLRSIL
ncbi:MAG: hypothetical protein GXP45_02910 [bacterium]|nr:hypothetical protein [bacterium]